MLYLIATPIGNLADFSERAIDALGKCDYILCEDTRHSRILLDRYKISTPLKSFHSFNEAQMEDLVIRDLQMDKAIALISDAGTPLISDPGHGLVCRCRQEGISVTAIPGPCALIQALVLSGFPAHLFQFIGFLPKKEKELQSALGKALFYPGTTIAYESPHRIEGTLQMLEKIAPQRTIAVARELTKLHEEVLIGTPTALSKRLTPRGEMVLLISPSAEDLLSQDLTLHELVFMLEKDLHLSKKEAIKMAAELRGLSKKDVYKQFIPLPPQSYPKIDR